MIGRKKFGFVLFIFLLMMSFIIIGCSNETGNESEAEPDPLENEPETPSEQPAQEEPTSFNESPFLSGKNLPPVEERLPNEPKVANAYAPDILEIETGQYGGTIRTVGTDAGFDHDVFGFLNTPLINTPSMLGEEITGNIFSGFDVSEDQQEFTFYMREGMHWSDGHPVTMDDIEFTVNDVLFNEELTPAFPGWLRSGGKGDGTPFQFEKIDDLSFKLTFDEPYGGFLLRMAIQGWRGYQDLLKPKHFMSQYHLDYADPSQLEAAIDEAGFEEGEWYNLFHAKDITNFEATHEEAIGFPVLQPWIKVEHGTTVSKYERNPYFFMVDEIGNQLPYIDTIESYLVQDAEMVTMKIIAGEADFVRGQANLVNAAIYNENAERAGYRVKLLDDHGTQNDVFFNMTFDDPVWREVVQQVNFRKAVSLGINRDEIIDAVYLGFADYSPMNDTTYDVEEGKRLLDEMGLEVGADGYRVGPDGQRFTIPFVIGGHIPAQIKTAELVVEMLGDLDLHTTLQTVDAGLWGTRNTANELQATIMWTHSPLWWYGDLGENNWAPLWNRWWTTGGSEGEEPPDEVKEFYTLRDQLSAGDPEDGVASYEQIIENMRENLWYILPAGILKVPAIFNADLGNVPDQGFIMHANFSGYLLYYQNLDE